MSLIFIQIFWKISCNSLTMGCDFWRILFSWLKGEPGQPGQQGPAGPKGTKGITGEERASLLYWNETPVSWLASHGILRFTYLDFFWHDEHQMLWNAVRVPQDWFVIERKLGKEKPFREENTEKQNMKAVHLNNLSRLERWDMQCHSWNICYDMTVNDQRNVITAVVSCEREYLCINCRWSRYNGTSWCERTTWTSWRYWPPR